MSGKKMGKEEQEIIGRKMGGRKMEARTGKREKLFWQKNNFQIRGREILAER